MVAWRETVAQLRDARAEAHPQGPPPRTSGRSSLDCVRICSVDVSRTCTGRDMWNTGRRNCSFRRFVRNGALYVHSFMDHSRRVGCRAHVFLDNGSTDDTVARLCAYPNVTVLHSDVPYAKYQNTMKRYLAERFSAGRWNLCADIDELFDYPSSDRLTLTALIAYLNARGFTAVIAQMLDMLL